jgi:hypothetical protein
MASRLEDQVEHLMKFRRIAVVALHQSDKAGIHVQAALSNSVMHHPGAITNALQHFGDAFEALTCLTQALTFITQVILISLEKVYQKE